jgi:hypothetical protein
MLEMSISAASVDHQGEEDKKSKSDIWDRSPRENRGWAGRRAREWVRGGR